MYKKKLQPNWAVGDEIEIIDRIAIKGRRIIIPVSLQDEAINQVHINCMGMERKNANI